MTGIEWQTALTAGLVSALFSYLGYVVFRRSEERRDEDVRDLKKNYEHLAEHRVAKLEKEVEAEGAKRRVIYERLENSALKLENVATKTEMMLQRMDENTRKQISISEDLSALTQRIENLEEKNYGQ